MIMPVSFSEWQMLRAVLRSGSLTGTQLYWLAPHRKNKGGGFLVKLAARDLLRVATPAPDPLAATYELTDRGRHAAEYGECEVVDTSRVRPVSAAKGGAR